MPDPTGANLQGTVGDHANGYLNDQDIADKAVKWLSARKTTEPPWCLTVSFVNPHDQQFFWAGTEFKTYNELFNRQSAYVPITFFSKNKGTDYPPVVAWDKDPLKDLPSFGYSALPPNWESRSQIANRKPSTQSFMQTFQGAVCGYAADKRDQTEYTIEAFPGQQSENYGVGIAPFSYWQRGLDCYTQLMTIVDERIGEVLEALPSAVARNTIVVFTSDHGEFAGAHGLLAGKAGSCYDEAFHVPLIIVDPTGRFCRDTDVVRTGLTSSVDMLTFLVSLGNNGKRDWITGDLAKTYGRRHDMIPMLRSAATPGRQYVLLATDKLVMGQFNFNQSPLHIVGLRTAEAKLAAYAEWRPLTTRIDQSSLELEFYDYSTQRGRAEIANTPDDPRVRPKLKTLLDDLIPHELRAPLPGALGVAQNLSRKRYVLFEKLINNVDPAQQTGELLRDWLGFGADF